MEPLLCLHEHYNLQKQPLFKFYHLLSSAPVLHLPSSSGRQRFQCSVTFYTPHDQWRVPLSCGILVELNKHKLWTFLSWKSLSEKKQKSNPFCCCVPWERGWRLLRTSCWKISTSHYWIQRAHPTALSDPTSLNAIIPLKPVFVMVDRQQQAFRFTKPMSYFFFSPPPLLHIHIC